MTKAKAAVIAALLALVGTGVALQIGSVSRRCTVAEFRVPCDILAQYAPALKCVDRQQVEIVVTAPTEELTGTAEDIVAAMEQRTGTRLRDLREALPGMTLITVGSQQGSDAQCPQQRLTIRRPQTGCIYGQVTDGERERFGQCCGAACSCTSACCTDVGRSELAGSHDFLTQLCEDCPGEARCQ